MYKKLLLSLLCCMWLVPVFGMLDLTAYDGTIMKRENAIKIFDINNMKRIGSGGSCAVYSLGNNRALRVKHSAGQRYLRSNKIHRELRAMKKHKPELPIVEIYSIFDIHANGYFYSSQVLSPSSEARKSIKDGYPDTYTEVVEMQEIKPYTDYNGMYGEVKVPGLQNLDSVNNLSDYELSELFLMAEGIILSDVGKLKNLGYILQEEPVEYTFVIKAQSKTYRVIADPITHDSQKLYRKTIFVDYDDWRTGKSIDENHISQELEKLCKDGKIKEVEQHNMMS